MSMRLKQAALLIVVAIAVSGLLLPSDVLARNSGTSTPQGRNDLRNDLAGLVDSATAASSSSSAIDFASAPTRFDLSLDRVGTLLVQKVPAGFVILPISGDQSATFLSWRDLEGFELAAMPVDNGLPPQVTIRHANIWRGDDELVLRLEDISDSGFSGQMLPAGQSQPIAVSATWHLPDAAPADSSAQKTDETPAGLGHVSGRFAITITIVITAAVIAALGCSAAALLTNCAQDCADACSSCSCKMQSSSEGACGTCDCTCDCSITGIIKDSPDGGGCDTAYH